MKNILITGEHSYIGDSLADWLAASAGEYNIDKVSFFGDDWKALDFSIYDSIVHVAGIAHVSADPAMQDKYYEVNSDLTYKIAEKAAADGVEQFIFMSSIIVYGGSNPENGVITSTTEPIPKDFYGDSKLRAEKYLEELADTDLKIAVIRPPMIYGKGSKGNYPLLAKYSKKLPIFPKFDNKRSMLHVDNLCEFIRLLIDNTDEGLFFPQNKDYVQTSKLVNEISNIHGHKMRLTPIFNPVIKPLVNRVNILNKVFGDLVYDKNMSDYPKGNYQVHSFEESITVTEK